MVMGSSTRFVFSPAFKRILIGIAALNCLVGIKRIIESFQADKLYRKDFIQEYLMAKAILNGVNPYLPLPELAEQWVSDSGFIPLQHPTPHPPVVGLISLPLGFLNYEAAALVWLFFELACLMVSVCLVLRWWGVTIKPGITLAAFAFALGWMPVTEDLWIGQLSTSLLVLLLCAWAALRNGKNAIGGALLGGMIALKLAAWPIVLYLALRRKWSGVLAAAAVAVTTHLAAIIVLGVDVVKDYYLKVGPLIASLYRIHDCNYSTWTLGKRLFDEFGYNFVTLPLWPSPLLVRVLTYLVPVVFLIFGLILALRAKQFDTSFGVLVIMGILVSPIAWTHYLMLAAIPILITARRLGEMRNQRRMIYTMFGISMLMSVTHGAYVNTACLFSTQAKINGVPHLPLWAAALTLMPAATTLGVLCMLWISDRIGLPQLAPVNSKSSDYGAPEIAPSVIQI